MRYEVRRAVQSLLFAADKQKDDGALRPGLHRRIRLRDLEHGRRTGSIIIRAVIDAVAGGIRSTYAHVIHVSAVNYIGLLERWITALEDADDVRNLVRYSARRSAQEQRSFAERVG